MEGGIVPVIAGVAVVLNLVNVVAVLVSILTPARIWPPGAVDWRYWLTWGCWVPATVGLFTTGVLDWGHLGVVPQVLQYVGIAVALVGVGVTALAMRGLGFDESEGLEGELQTGGLYRYSRNPQTIGDLVATVGWVVASDSGLTLLVGATYAMHFLLLPFAEEPWLQEQYGAAYAAYRRTTPRFVGRATITRLLGAGDESEPPAEDT